MSKTYPTRKFHTRHMKTASAQRDAARANRNVTLEERNLLLALLARLYPMHVSPATLVAPDYTWDEAGQQWLKTGTAHDADVMRWVVCVHTEVAKLAWKIDDDARQEIFAHVPDGLDDWIPHTLDQKRDYLETLVAHLQQQE